MSAIPNVAVAVDISANAVSIALASDTAVLTPYIRFTCTKVSFFDALGIQYTVSKNVNNVVTSISALARSSVQSSHITSRAGDTSLSSWINGPSNGNVINVPYTFQGTSKSIIYDLANASAVLGASSLGKHIAFMVTHAMLIRHQSSATALFAAATLSTLAASIETQVGTLVASAVATQANQQSFLNKIIASNGPVIQETGGYLKYTTDMSDIDIMITLTNVKFDLTVAGNVKTLVLTSVPICIRLIS